MKLSDFDFDDPFHFENGFYLTSEPKRLGKLLAHFELYRRASSLPGQVLEFGVFKGASLIRFATFRHLLETDDSRKIVGFDAFGAFPGQGNELDQSYADKHDAVAGTGISKADLESVFERKKIANVELVGGDINKTLPDYIAERPELKIALLHIDVDVYAPTKTILEHCFDRVVPGGIIVLDDYATVAGETRAVDEFVAGKNIQIKKLPICHVPSYFIK